MNICDSTPILSVKNLKKTLNAFALSIPYLAFHKGKIYGLTGPNGSGKTTLLSLLNLLEKPDAGKIFYKGEVISYKRLDIRRKMVMVLENPYLFNSSVMNNITYGLRVRSTDKKRLQEKINKTLKLLNLIGFENRKANELSRGEIQRVAIARAIILNPEILFLDEPFTNIDKAHVNVVEKLIRYINKKKDTTIILTTHNLFQAFRLSSKVVSIVDGRVVKGSIENLFTGMIEVEENAIWVRITPSFRIAVITEKRNQVQILVPPEDIILSQKPFQSSARNVLKGKIKRIEIEGNTVRAECEAGVDLVTLITKSSLDRMKLSIGSKVYLTFKTTSVKVF